MLSNALAKHGPTLPENAIQIKYKSIVKSLGQRHSLRPKPRLVILRGRGQGCHANPAPGNRYMECAAVETRVAILERRLSTILKNSVPTYRQPACIGTSTYAGDTIQQKTLCSVIMHRVTAKSPLASRRSSQTALIRSTYLGMFSPG